MHHIHGGFVQDALHQPSLGCSWMKPPGAVALGSRILGLAAFHGSCPLGHLMGKCRGMALVVLFEKLYLAAVEILLCLFAKLLNRDPCCCSFSGFMQEYTQEAG